MSDYPVKQEPDHIDLPKVIAWTIGTVVLFGIGAVWVVLNQKGDWGSLHNEFHATDYVKKDMVGMVYQKAFDFDYGARAWQPQREALKTLKYLDPKHEKAQVPIDRAMDIYVKRGGKL